MIRLATLTCFVLFCVSAFGQIPNLMKDKPGRNVLKPDSKQELPATQSVKAGMKLTDHQRTSIERLRRELKKLNIPLQKEVELKSIELEEMLEVESPNREKIMQSIKRIGDLNAQIRINYILTQLEIRKFLTVEQKEALRERGLGYKLFAKPTNKARLKLD